MKVTGWTYWEDPNYINITYETMKQRAAILKAFPIPSREKLQGLTSDEISKLLDENSKKQAAAIAEWYKNSELTKIEDQMEDVVIDSLRENNYHFTGDTHQNYDYGVPIIDDKYIYCISTRSWGHLMAKAFPDEDYSKYEDHLKYLKWAWTYPENEKIILPKREDD